MSRFLAVAVAVAVAVAAAAAAAATLLAFAATARAQTAINVYGPGGPARAMKEAAAAFASKHKITVNVVAGPTPQWAEQATQDADVIFSGAENMMFDFAKVLPGVFDLRQAYPHYRRPASILVRPGNPKRIRGVHDLLKPGVRVLTVAGAGQVGLWEDVIGRTGDVAMVRALRSNIVFPRGAEQRRRQTAVDRAA